TFVRETGMDVQRPEAAQTRALESESMRISVTPSGAIFTEGQQIDLSALRQRVRQFIAAEATGSVIIIPDEQLAAGRLVAVMDAARAGGATDIALATRQRQ
ncbi:MAG: biopolymer transporter ExbD, partial [Phycisphaeraceae bacterium]